MSLRIFNSLTKRVEVFVPADPARVTFYSCGPTVYDDAHIGNFRSFLAADLLRRWLESPWCEVTDGAGEVVRGPRTVVHVMNITDVGHMTDDAEGGESGEDRMAVAGKRLLEAKKAGTLPADVQIDPGNPYQIAGFYAGRFLEDARRLGLKVALEARDDPTLMPRATANVAGMIEVVERLLARGHAYVAGAPGARAVYFRVRSFPGYGRLSGNTLESLREGAGGRISGANQSQKEHPADFLLWKEDPGHIMKWESPWGAGYPGWHIECTVMSARRLLGEGEFRRLLESPTAPGPIIDLHSGGEDNIFPHHECEIAQSCCAFNASPERGTFARLWFHPRFLLVEGAKMSKSKGNFFTARDLFARDISPSAVRFELIRTHYRSNADFSTTRAVQAGQQIEAWVEGAAMLKRAADLPWATQGRFLDVIHEFVEALHDDLNAAKAIAAFYGFFSGSSSPMAQAITALRGQGWDVSLRGTIHEWVAELPTQPLSPRDAIQEFERGRRDGTFREAWAALHIMDAVVGIIFVPRQSGTQIGSFIFAPGVPHGTAVTDLLEARRAARAAKDFKRSDAIRDELAAMGYAIKDVAGGKVEVRRK